MRLLDARTITLRSFVSENEVPRYAILSHTWGREEVAFDDLNGSDPSQLYGYEKLNEACRQTRRDGIHYLWMDTCCIDKRSSSELSEAINSMFKWYKAAAVCYAYLQDVEVPDIESFKNLSNLTNLNLTSKHETHIQETRFAKSRWWTRGWTLQELIAPSELIFYNKFFKRIGSKEELVRVISVISGVDEAVLLHKLSLKDVCVATRMSWAAKRKTTRIEDIAYSLLGIFGINMAMLYGEGNRAFIRLQEEIIKSTNDQSIFTWNGYKYENGSLFAHRPSCFKSTDRIVPLQHWKNRSEFSLTNAGLDIALPLLKSNANPQKDRDGAFCPRRCWVAPLACRYEMDFSGRIALELEETEEKGTLVLHPRMQRLFVIKVNAETTPDRMKSVMIRQENADPIYQSLSPQLVFNKKCVIRWPGYQCFLQGRQCYPPDSWNERRDVLWVKRGASVMGVLHLLTLNESDIVLRVGYDREENRGAVSWGKEWIVLEGIETGTAFHEYCVSRRKRNSHPENVRKKWEIRPVGTTSCLEAKISRCNILEEDVFLVEISVKGIE